MRFFKLTAATCAFALLLVGCASADRVYGDAAEIAVTDLRQLPSPEYNAYHRIGPQEVLKIEVAGSDFLSGEFLTDKSGRLDFPLIGGLDLAGLTPREASQLIADSLRGQYVLNPQVNVIPDELDAISISVGGQVDKPGSYPATNGLTLLRAVNLAGGQGEYANLEEVLVFREVAGKNYIGVYNLEAIQLGNYSDPALYPNDVVMVGNSPSKRRLETILQFLPVLSTAAILIDRVGR